MIVYKLYWSAFTEKFVLINLEYLNSVIYVRIPYTCYTDIYEKL